MQATITRSQILPKMLNNAEPQTILVTGGCGYIGAHVVRQLIDTGYKVVIIDNLSTGLQTNTHTQADLYIGDLSDTKFLQSIFAKYKFSAVVHLAASIEVGESVEKPIEYLENNTLVTTKLLEIMNLHSVKTIIFSSTAAVYGYQDAVPIPENAILSPVDPYGSSKMISEQILAYYAKHLGFSVTVFRFFNACGSDFDKTIYSTHDSHLITQIVKVISGQKNSISVFGNDYPTKDGTGVRDYVHVLDIARAHVLALQHNNEDAMEIYNIGTGSGYSVLDIIHSAERVFKVKIPIEWQPRRPGDSIITIADNSKITKKLGFSLKYSDLQTILKTSIK